MTNPKNRIIQLIRDKNILEYSDLLDYLLDAEEYELHNVASRNTILFNNYIKSRKYKLFEERRKENLKQ